MVLQNMVCDHNYTTLANEQGPPGSKTCDGAAGWLMMVS
eukprot:COSAG01_NODE_152_length_23937_cov_122.193976_8_plen_39_part_00